MTVISLEKLLDKIKLQNLKFLCKENKIKQKFIKGKIITDLVESCEKKGTIDYWASLTKPCLESMISDLDIKMESESVSKMLAECKQKYEPTKLNQFLKKFSVKTLNQMCKCLDFEIEKSDAEKKKLVEAISDEIMIRGMNKLFLHCKIDFLRKLCEDVGISKTSKGREEILHEILGKSFPHLLEMEVVKKNKGGKKVTKSSEKKKTKKGKKETKKGTKGTKKGKKGTKKGKEKNVKEKKVREKKVKEKKVREKKVKEKKEKVAIKDGVTYDEIFQDYLVEDLQKYLKDKSYKSTGAKKILIKRVLLSLEKPDDPSLKPISPHERGGKKKKGGKRKKEGEDKDQKEAKKKKT